MNWFRIFEVFFSGYSHMVFLPYSVNVVIFICLTNLAFLE